MTANMHTCLLFVCPFVTGTTIDTGCCEITTRASCKTCCLNYYMVNDTCKGCPVGSMGKHCSIVCPYPFFGPDCKNQCDCEENICHEVKGCLDPKISAPYDQSTQKGNMISDGQFSSKTLIITIAAALGTCFAGYSPLAKDEPDGKCTNPYKGFQRKLTLACINCKMYHVNKISNSWK